MGKGSKWRQTDFKKYWNNSALWDSLKKEKTDEGRKKVYKEKEGKSG